MSEKHLGKLELTFVPESITEKECIVALNLRAVGSLETYNKETMMASNCEDSNKAIVPDDELPPVPNLQLGYYRHSKGNIYQVINIARNSSNLDEFHVIYVGQKGDVWFREYYEFIGHVRGEKRFTYIPEYDLIPSYVPSREAEAKEIMKMLEADIREGARKRASK
jgi:hypothetical protein